MKLIKIIEKLQKEREKFMLSNDGKEPVIFNTTTDDDYAIITVTTKVVKVPFGKQTEGAGHEIKVNLKCF